MTTIFLKNIIKSQV